MGGRKKKSDVRGYVTNCRTVRPEFYDLIYKLISRIWYCRVCKVNLHMTSIVFFYKSNFSIRQICILVQTALLKTFTVQVDILHIGCFPETRWHHCNRLPVQLCHCVISLCTFMNSHFRYTSINKSAAFVVNNSLYLFIYLSNIKSIDSELNVSCSAKTKWLDTLGNWPLSDESVVPGFSFSVSDFFLLIRLKEWKELQLPNTVKNPQDTGFRILAAWYNPPDFTTPL